MKQLIKQSRLLIAGMALALAVGGAGLSAVPVSAADEDKPCTGATCMAEGAKKVKTGSGASSNLNTAITSVTNILLFLIGAVGVIMIVIGGFKYVVSNGDAEKIKSAKNTILYAVIGIAAAIMAYAIVRWVIASLTAAPPES